MKSYLIYLLIGLLWGICLTSPAQGKRPIGITDIITMTRLGDPGYFSGSSAEGKVALYSPDGRRFVIVLRKADIPSNSNIYSMYGFRTDEILQRPKPRLLTQFRSSSNGPGISELKWLKDNRTIAFLGRRGKGSAQIYEIDTSTRRLQAKTNQSTGVDHFDVSGDGKVLLYAAPLPLHEGLTPDQMLNGLLIEKQTLEDLYSGKYNDLPLEDGLYLMRGRTRRVVIPTSHQINRLSQISISPDGESAFVTAYWRLPHPTWARYQDRTLKAYSSGVLRQDGPTMVFQYFILDTVRGCARALLNAPARASARASWAPDGHSVLVKTFLPLDDVDGDELQVRTNSPLPAAITVPELTLNRISETEWEHSQRPSGAHRPIIQLREGINDPPKIVASSEDGKKTVMLMDLNPQFAELQFGEVRSISFAVHDVPVRVGLYLPPGYEPGKKYPLVIQTHGFDESRFSMDGRNEWSSCFAARALAAAGMLVVQTYGFENPEDNSRMQNDATFGATPEIRARNFTISVFETTVHTLDKEGLIETDRVGISGFSRTVWFASYLLTHSNLKIRTAVLTDGVDCSYFGYIARGLKEFEADNGGLAPFGDAGLALWDREAPGFNLDKVHIPVRLVSLEDPTSEWEWYQGLKLQKKAVEMVAIPGSSHLLERPQDRLVAMRGLVDWYRYWLMDERTPTSEDQLEYERWNRLVSTSDLSSNREEHP